MKSEKKKKTRDQKLTGQVCEKNKASLGLEPKPRPVFFPRVINASSGGFSQKLHFQSFLT
jgi:hypothetical protein